MALSQSEIYALDMLRAQLHVYGMMPEKHVHRVIKSLELTHRPEFIAVLREVLSVPLETFDIASKRATQDVLRRVMVK